MNTIRIGSLNIQNSKVNRTGGITPDGKDNTKILAEHIENSGYYFLGTQELTRRLYQILEILSIEYPIVLTGDFNMELGKDIHFDNFINKLENIGLKRVQINEYTFIAKDNTKKIIDHIFIPKSWIIEKAGLIEDKNIDSITDHKGIYTDVRVR